ncbi:EAL domain-containing protein [Desulfobotulus sp. H1]|uniref:EAL domain-containing protein n=1 Tax=Desulfobotulus pelophilus TaxID=2823377 RepID=A0ABT3NAM3_9BACT|nr:EAL domain-containing protein [Desulfobotulus pelophilus]MCW7754511.1 EAL domain-containing protein [Desulfobotulus pelophilus]
MSHPSYLPQDLESLLKGLERRIADISQVLEKGQKDLDKEDLLRLQAWDVADTGLCVVDEAGHFVDVNPAYTRIYGYDRDELLARHFTLVLPEEKKETARRALARFFDMGEEPPMEWEVRHKDGRPLRILATAGLLKDEAGKRYKITSVMDVTEARRNRDLQLRLGRIFESLQEEIFLLDPATFLFQDANASALQNCGYDLGALRSMHAWDLFMGMAEGDFRDVIGDLSEGRECGRVVTAHICRKDKTCYEAELRLQYIQAEDTSVYAMMVRDITLSMQTLRALQESEETLSEAQQVAGIGSWKMERGTGVLRWSRQMFRNMKMPDDDADPDFGVFLKQVPETDHPRIQAAVDAAWNEGRAFHLEHGVRVGGELRIFSVNGRAVTDGQGQVMRLVGTSQDITENKKVQAELHKLTMAIEQSTNVVFITDRHGTIEYVNKVFERVTGYVREEVIGQNPRILASGETRPETYASLWETILSGHTWRGDFKNKTKNGSFYWGKGLISPVRGHTGEIVNFLAIQEDTTEKKQAEERALYLETYDVQTGLLNRDSFIRRLSEEFSGRGVGMLIDIDGFKLINDQIGYARGDGVLRRLIRMVRQTLEARLVPESWFMGRFGGDQMALFVRNMGGAEALALGEEIRSRVESGRFEEGGVRVTVSAGLALIPEHAGDGVTFLAVLDAALGKAKEFGKNRCRIFVPEDREGELKRATFYQKQRILDALASDRFDVWYQPIMRLSDRSIAHYEALVRLREPDGRMVLPGAFIQAAERHGLVGSIDRVVAGKTFVCQAGLKKRGRIVSFSMNLSGRDLADAGMASFMKRSILESGADPGQLIFEITETAAIQDMDRALDFIRQMKALGCRFSLDDFGVGFTSFVYLRELGVDFIKIDGSFIRKLHERQEDRSVVRAIVQMAREMGIQTVAEFVEQAETMKLLTDFGVDYGQGFLIGKPAPFGSASSITIGRQELG